MEKAGRVMKVVQSKLTKMSDRDTLAHIKMSDMSPQTDAISLLTQWEHLTQLVALYKKLGADRLEIGPLIFVLAIRLVDTATPAQKAELESFLLMLGFTLDFDGGGKKAVLTTDMKDRALGISIQRFQLAHCGAQMSIQRVIKSVPDKRVPFIPDSWQTQLLDIVDRKESALICAPTSSGKTYVSYYAMQQILETNDTDIVVYGMSLTAWLTRQSRRPKLWSTR